MHNNFPWEKLAFYCCNFCEICQESRHNFNQHGIHLLLSDLGHVEDRLQLLWES